MFDTESITGVQLLTPDEWVEDKNGVWINSRVKIEKAGECTILTA
jgi:hypothetical protein